MAIAQNVRSHILSWTRLKVDGRGGEPLLGNLCFALLLARKWVNMKHVLVVVNLDLHMMHTFDLWTHHQRRVASLIASADGGTVDLSPKINDDGRHLIDIMQQR
jgi:hypothetical protein